MTFRLEAAAMLWLAASLGAQSGELLIVKETGPRDKRVNLVIIGDGYVASEKALFLSHVRTFSDAVVKDAPLAGYANYFNIYAIFVASRQSGADNPSQGVFRDTYLDAGYDAALGRLLVIDFSKGFELIDKHVPERDISLAIVNSDQYGGSGGPIAVANHTAPEITAHEVQHSFTNLGDEYDYPGVSPWEAPNTTTHATRTGVTWKQWVDVSTPVPTPETPAYRNLIGVFEGAAYNQKGWFRPKQTCRMRENEQPFCAVCSEAILLRIYDRVSPMDSSSPAGKSVTVAAGISPGLRVVPKATTTHDLKIEWVLDGRPVPAVIGPVFDQGLTAGLHRVTARISDPNPMIRGDADRVTRDSATWEVVVSGVSSAAAGDGKGELEILGVSRGRVSFRLPRPGAFRLSAFAQDGRRIWTHADGEGLPGLNAIDLALGTFRGTGRSSSAVGVAFLRVEQDGRTSRARALLLD